MYAVGGGGDQLGKLYGVIHKRRGKIVSEDLLEGTQTFVIKAMLPVRVVNGNVCLGWS